MLLALLSHELDGHDEKGTRILTTCPPSHAYKSFRQIQGKQLNGAGLKEQIEEKYGVERTKTDKVKIYNSISIVGVT